MGKKKAPSVLDFGSIDETGVNYELTNLATFYYYLQRILSIAKTRFDIKNLPDYIPYQRVEQYLLHRGGVAWFVDDVTGMLMALPFVQNTGFDPYGLPNGWEAYGQNGYRRSCTKEDSVIMWDNYNMFPIFRDLAMFAKRLEIIERTMDTNIQGQKTPYILTGSKQQVSTLMELYREMEANAPAIIVDNSLALENVTTTPTVTPFIADKLQIIKRNIFNECMTFLGIQNANSEKRERLVDAEATGTQGMILNQLYSFLKPRQEAIELINKKFAEFLPNGPLEITINTLEEGKELGINDNGLPEIEAEVQRSDRTL